MNKENNTKIIERLRYFAENQKENFHSMSKKIGVSNSYFNKMDKNRGSMGTDILNKIVLFYEELNLDWLLTGRGEMLRNSQNNIIGKHIECNSGKSKSIGGIENNSGNIAVNQGVIQKGHNNNTGNNIKMGNNSTINTHNVDNLVEMLKDKDYIIAQLRKKIEDTQNEMTRRLDEMFARCDEKLSGMQARCDERMHEMQMLCNERIKEKDNIIVTMMEREKEIVQSSYLRNHENLERMDKMHERLFEMQEALIGLLKNTTNASKD